LIVPIHAANPGPLTGNGNWTYFFPGRHPVLIDAGVGVAAHLDGIGRASSSGPRRVLVSHAHSDHITGVSALADRWPDTEFAKFPWPERDSRHPVTWESLSDGQLIPAGDSELEVVHTPGHAPDHIAFWHAPTRTLLSADLVTAGTTVAILASQGGSLSQYLRSLQRVLDLNPARLLPAHGDPIGDPAAQVRRYIDHRRMRERQVLEALEAGVGSVEDIVERIYVGLADPLVRMARESVLAHLLKLQDEGLARRQGDTWTTDP
jgi:glyoxylase-like metal-dependent hydrolase (beta-lactamase superfamily II)